MDKITKILLIVAVILIIIWVSMTFIVNSNFDFSSFNQNNKVNDNLNGFSNGNNATIKILSSKSLTKNENVIVQLFDNKNQPMANKYVSCRFFNSSSIGNSFTTHTDEKGIAEFNLNNVNPGFWGIEIEYKSYDDKIGSCIIQDNIEIKNNLK